MMFSFSKKIYSQRGFTQRHFFGGSHGPSLVLSKKSGAACPPMITQLGGGRRGFSLIELLAVMLIILVLSVIGLKSYQEIEIRNRDSERKTSLNLFVKQLESFRAEFGYYPCGDDCVIIDSIPYSVDCSYDSGEFTPAGVLEGSYTIEGTGEVVSAENGFLNGGDCCNLDLILYGGEDHSSYGGYPAPDSLNDEMSWGLYSHNYSNELNPQDPLETTLDGKEYTYCYATPAFGRKSFALFSLMESSVSLPENDGDLCPLLYDIESPGYPNGGWAPDSC